MFSPFCYEPFSFCMSSCCFFRFFFLLFSFLANFFSFLFLFPSFSPINNVVAGVRSLYSLLKIRFKVQQHTKNRETIGTLFKKVADSHPNKIAFHIEDRIWNYQNVEDYSNTVANHFLRAGYHPGDVVALFKESCPEYVCIWLGLSKIGIITALINFNLRGYSLLHCINDAQPKAIIYGSELAKGNVPF